MSYPRLIQPLVIEDETTEFYEAVFEQLVAEGAVAPPRYAYCYQDALKMLRSDTIFHLVVLDLRLPDLPNKPAKEGLDHGLALLDQCAKRDGYPVPALLVISGHVGQANQRDLEMRVKTGFYYGRVLVKGLQLQDDLLEAVRAVQAYCDIGIHIRDAGERVYPTISPREEDLLRRCVLGQANCTGLDLEWWSSEYQRPTGPYEHCMGWTKTLIGRFLLGRGARPSRYNFFKLAPAGGAESSICDAQLMQLMLGHVKVRSSEIGGKRSLLVTEKVGVVDERPFSLSDLMVKSADAVNKRLPQVVEEVASQVLALGDTIPHRTVLSGLLWADHNLAKVKEQWRLHSGPALLDEYGPDADPITLFDELASDVTPVRYDRQTSLHGDLNITNIALERTEQGVHAYIFDASGCSAGVNVRDLAMLEVSALLHQTPVGSESLVRHCAELYDVSVPAPETLDFSRGTDQARNTLKLIAEIRAQALKRAELPVYALMVFDHAMIQLGGLHFGVSCNKIASPTDAVRLSALAARWLRDVLRTSSLREGELVNAESN